MLNFHNFPQKTNLAIHIHILQTQCSYGHVYAKPGVARWGQGRERVQL